jgi:hypothetical protein
VIPGWIIKAPCCTVGCDAVATFWSDIPVFGDDRAKLVDRALTAIGWLAWEGRASCPEHYELLRSAVVEGTAGPFAEALRWALAQRWLLGRIEVTP